jgi:hypothetical protein
MNRIDRIKEMEAILDAGTAAIADLQAALARYEALKPDLERLSAYYGSPLWRGDFEADEAGNLPKDLKRGVLSEDAVYDLLTEVQALEAVLQNAPKDENK